MKHELNRHNIQQDNAHPRPWDDSRWRKSSHTPIYETLHEAAADAVVQKTAEAFLEALPLAWVLAWAQLEALCSWHYSRVAPSSCPPF